MKKLNLTLSLWLFYMISVFAQKLSDEEAKKLFEEAWNTSNDIERISKNKKILEEASNTPYGLHAKAWFEMKKGEVELSIVTLDTGSANLDGRKN